MTRNGKLFVISAPSGTGKTTVVRRLLKEYPFLIESTSYTTRKPRIGEKDNVDYHFVDERTFKRLVSENFFAEWALVHGSLYGTPSGPIEDALREGKKVVLDVDVQGGVALKRHFPHAITVFLLPPSEEELVRRLRGRGTEAEEEIETRLTNANRELTYKEQYDHQMVNDEIDHTVDELAKLMDLK